MKTKIALPSVHLNGSGAQLLGQQYHACYMAIQAAIVAMREATPHDRDYYIQGPDAGPQARREHNARVAQLEKMLEDVGRIWRSVTPALADGVDSDDE